MVMTQFAYIPTIGLSPHLPGLLNTLEKAQCMEAVWVIQNKRPEAANGVAHLCRTMRPAYTCFHEYDETMSLYAGWNTAINDAYDHAQEIEDDVLLHVFNDDVILEPRAVLAMSVEMENDSSITLGGYGLLRANATTAPISGIHARDVTGTYRERGINGCAWTLRLRHSEEPVQVDEQFEWWGGDDDLVYQLVTAQKRCVLFPNIWVKHPQPGLSANATPECAAMVERDRLRLLAKWGTAW